MKSTIKIKVRGYHIDQFKHVNNARYLEFLEEGRWSYSEDRNLINSFHSSGIAHVNVNININYRKSAFVGNVLRIETDLLRKTRKSVTMQQNIYLNETNVLIADAEVTSVYLNDKTGDILSIDEEFIKIWSDLAVIVQ